MTIPHHIPDSSNSQNAAPLLVRPLEIRVPCDIAAAVQSDRLPYRFRPSRVATMHVLKLSSSPFPSHLRRYHPTHRVRPAQPREVLRAPPCGRRDRAEFGVFLDATDLLRTLEEYLQG